MKKELSYLILNLAHSYHKILATHAEQRGTYTQLEHGSASHMMAKELIYIPQILSEKGW